MEKVSLSWSEFGSCASNTFIDLLSDQDFTDVTLVCDDDKQIKAHKVILSSCSPLFRRILKNNPHQHPLIYLNGIRFDNLQSVIKFIYLGQTEVEQDDLELFMKAGKELKIKGLSGNDSTKDFIDENNYIEYDYKQNINDFNTTMEYKDDCKQNLLEDYSAEQENSKQFDLVLFDGTNIDASNIEVMKNVTGKFPCEECRYEATRADNLKCHIMAKHKGVKYECPECSKTFSINPI